MRPTLDALLAGVSVRGSSACCHSYSSYTFPSVLQNVPAGLDPAPLQLDEMTDTWNVAMQTARSDAHCVPCARSMKRFANAAHFGIPTFGLRVCRLMASACHAVKG